MTIINGVRHEPNPITFRRIDMKAKKESKKTLSLWMTITEFDKLEKDCQAFNQKNGLELSVNRYVLKILRESKIQLL